MLAFGAQLAQATEDTAVIFLSGELGAGKTTLVRGFMRGLGFTDKVKSPTFTLVESYSIAHQQVFHFDLYRLQDAKELEFMGIQDYFAAHHICLIEWPERGKDWLPVPDLSCYIQPHLSGRELHLQAQTTRGETILKNILTDNNE